MSEPGTPTFDQLKIFLAVVENGSFAGAGRALNRATSAITYGIANFEAQLGLTLFERQGTRKPRLTVAGNAVLAEARAIGQGMNSLRARVKGLLEGLEAQVDLAIDVMLPSQWLGDALRAFYLEFPTVTLNLHVEALGAVTALVLEGTAKIGISGPLAAETPDIETVAIGSVPLVPVAAPHHPLAMAGALSPGMGRLHVQLVLTDRSPLTQGREFAVVSPHTWRLADLGAKLALLREGIGWGNMPRPMIEADLAAGTLVELKMPDDPGVDYRLSCIYRSDTPPGPATAWLLARFQEGAARHPIA
ncbi:LysR family transcriptional regulator [Novosphingobium profundi]|uniref:LysR family transcriptional regulator n=1 Tax=Novosphingobium profundi TaxID=1774954 RepID=UPI001BD922B2|nr:LysR family transcriptional regulator [Novosphingobium profundi]MBT0670172.1 LysR family transcriptional regulator [Novosphingobium profundi]